MSSAMIPAICISPAPLEPSPVEPYSPFSNTRFTVPADQEDAFRPFHLTPPPTHTSFRRGLSPLGSAGTDSPRDSSKPNQTGKGLDRARFEALLNASKAKPVLPKKDATDLRKEIAIKAHNKAGRRAIFLSKVLAPPSPTAVGTPKTPPETPSIFHYSLPSPGLISPIAHYESLHENDGISANNCQPWVEEIDFKLKLAKPRASAPAKGRQALPSLEQISARMQARGQADRISSSDPVGAFHSAPPVTSEQPRLVVGRLRMPVRSNTNPKCAPTPTIKISFPEEDDAFADTYVPPVPQTHKTIRPIPRPLALSPAERTSVDRVVSKAQAARETCSSAMLSTLRRRTQSSSIRDAAAAAPQGFGSGFADNDPRKIIRRHSAPPESMGQRQRLGFEHPVLRLPGAF